MIMVFSRHEHKLIKTYLHTWKQHIKIVLSDEQSVRNLLVRAFQNQIDVAYM